MKPSPFPFLLLLLFLFSSPSSAQHFQDWFEEGAMRVDLVFSGDANESTYALSGWRKEPFFSGSRKSLVDPFDYGDHMFQVKDAGTGALLFRQTYCTLYREWLTTTESTERTRAYPHVLRFPWPKEQVDIEVYDRDAKGHFQLVWTDSFDPATIFADPVNPLPFEVKDLKIHGDPEEKVDLLFLAEGYTEAEMEKFLADAVRSAEYIFSEEPFTSRRKDFNVRAVLSFGTDSGTDIPGQGVWKRTVMNSGFYTFGVERYMTTPDFRTVSDVASNAHYDQIYILVNTPKYGGGGIYNHYSISAADNEASRAVVIHEFGHAFGGLADEYYNSEVAYNDYFPLDVEPWNPNLTTLVSFGEKWEGMLAEGTPVPTPADENHVSVLGVYEGGGYVAKGVFRPMVDCRMHSNDATFCPVCSRAIEKMIDRYTGGSEQGD
ncbi:MAG: M64 family metallopeptidase [Bacteroidales bacterium]